MKKLPATAFSPCLLISWPGHDCLRRYLHMLVGAANKSPSTRLAFATRASRLKAHVDWLMPRPFWPIAARPAASAADQLRPPTYPAADGQGRPGPANFTITVRSRCGSPVSPASRQSAEGGTETRWKSSLGGAAGVDKGQARSTGCALREKFPAKVIVTRDTALFQASRHAPGSATGRPGHSRIIQLIGPGWPTPSDGYEGSSPFPDPDRRRYYKRL